MPGLICRRGSLRFGGGLEDNTRPRLSTESFATTNPSLACHQPAKPASTRLSVTAHLIVLLERQPTALIAVDGCTATPATAALQRSEHPSVLMVKPCVAIANTEYVLERLLWPSTARGNALSGVRHCCCGRNHKSMRFRVGFWPHSPCFIQRPADVTPV